MSGRRHPMRAVLQLAAVAALAAGLACSSGDGNEDVLDIPPPRSATVTTEIQQILDGGGSVPGAPYITLEEVSQSNETLTIKARVVGVTDLFSVAFTLEFDPAVMRFVDDSEQSLGFLGPSSEVDVLAELEPARQDRLVVGATREDASTGGRSGTGDILTLTFDLVGVGATDLAFAPAPANTAAIDSTSTVIFGRSKFFGATVRVQ